MSHEYTRQFSTFTSTIGWTTFKYHGWWNKLVFVIDNQFIRVVSLATITSSVLTQESHDLVIRIFIHVFVNGIVVMPDF